MKVRKPINELTVADLSAFPVWEYASDEEREDGQDETTVRPVNADLPIQPDDGPFQIRAIFTLADGSKMTGFLTVSSMDLSDLGYTQPVIVTDHGQVLFWLGSFAEDDYPSAAYQTLGHTKAATFPIQVHTDHGILTDDVEISIPGFLVLENWETNEVRVLS
jgi:hypothetical protein